MAKGDRIISFRPDGDVADALDYEIQKIVVKTKKKANLSELLNELLRSCLIKEEA